MECGHLCQKECGHTESCMPCTAHVTIACGCQHNTAIQHICGEPAYLVEKQCTHECGLVLPQCGHACKSKCGECY